MNPIITKELTDVRYALGSYDTAKNRYNQIKRTFPEGNEYRIFAEPIILSEGMKISWVTEYDGQVINFGKLTPEQQSKAKDMLSDQIKKLLNAAKKFDDATLVDFLYKCIEIPNLNDIFIVRKNNEDKVVITQWGFMSDIPGAEKGLLEKIINAKRVPMPFNVIYMDGEIAPGIEVHFEYEGKKVILKSNDQGLITIENVKMGTFVKAYEVEDDVPLNHHTFTCYEFGSYQIKVLQRIDMRFKVVTNKQIPMPGLTFNLEYKNQKTTLTTDNAGIMILPRIKQDTEVKVYQLNNGIEENINRFIAEKGKAEYLIVINVPDEVVIAPPPPEAPKVYNMRFKVVDDKNEAVPNAEVTLQYNGKTAKLFTDNEGYAILEGVEPGTQVKVVARGKKNSKK